MHQHPLAPAATTTAMPLAAVIATTSDWRQSLPILTGTGFTLRELRLSDAPSLLALLTTAEVSRFISPPPSTVDGFERFIQWAQRERGAGNYACFGIVPEGSDAAIGIFQLRQLEPGFATAEWGFALGSSFWGTRTVSRRRASGCRFRLRPGRRAPSRGPRCGAERARQRRAEEDWRESRVRAAQVVPAQWRISRPGPVDNSRRRLAAGEASADRADALTATSCRAALQGCIDFLPGAGVRHRLSFLCSRGPTTHSLALRRSAASRALRLRRLAGPRRSLPSRGRHQAS